MESKTMDLISLIFEGVILSIIGCLGLLGNAMAISYFGNPKRRRQTFYGLMLVLAALDLLLIISCFLVFSLPTISERYKKSHVWHYTVLWVLPVAQMCFSGNTYTSSSTYVTSKQIVPLSSILYVRGCELNEALLHSSLPSFHFCHSVVVL